MPRAQAAAKPWGRRPAGIRDRRLLRAQTAPVTVARSSSERSPEGSGCGDTLCKNGRSSTVATAPVRRGGNMWITHSIGLVGWDSGENSHGTPGTVPVRPCPRCTRSRHVRRRARAQTRRGSRRRRQTDRSERRNSGQSSMTDGNGPSIGVQIQTKVRGDVVLFRWKPPRGEHLRPVRENHRIFRVLADHAIIVPGVSP